MKRVAFFLGRQHHAQKLLPIASYGGNRGSFEVDILVADNAINIDPPTEFLSQYNIVNYYHSKDFQTPVEDSSVHQVIRSVFQTDIIKNVPPFWILYSAREALENLSGFSNYLRKVRPDAVFVLHTQNFWAKILAYCATNMKIPVYSLQEGIVLENEERDMGKYSGATDYVSTVFTWSEYDRQFYGETDKIVPVGPSHLDKWLMIRNDAARREQLTKQVKGRLGLSDSPLITIAFPRLDLFRGSPEKVVRSVGSWAVRRGYGVTVSLHPFQGRVPELEGIVKIYPNMAMFVAEDPMELVICSDVIISQTGTISLEAIALDIPVAEVNLDRHHLDQPLYKQGGAFLLDDIEKMEELMKRTAKDVAEFKAERLPLADARARDRIVEYVINDGN